MVGTGTLNETYTLCAYHVVFAIVVNENREWVIGAMNDYDFCKCFARENRKLFDACL